MNTLTNNEFKTYFNSLTDLVGDENISLNDSYGSVCNLNIVSQEADFELAIIDDIEYKLTEVQKKALLDYAESLIKNNRDSAFNDKDYAHFENLIHV